jgi:hypothetical protein
MAVYLVQACGVIEEQSTDDRDSIRERQMGILCLGGLTVSSQILARNAHAEVAEEAVAEVVDPTVDGE